MMIFKLTLPSTFYFFFLFCVSIDLPPTHTALNSSEGIKYFQEGIVDISLLQATDSQINGATCSLATSSAILNSFDIPAPPSTVHNTYAHFDEESLFNISCVQNIDPGLYHEGATS